METEKKKSGWLSKVFWGAVKVVAIGLVPAVAWQIFLDPLFFPIFHDPTNATAQAWMMMINDYFGWIPRLVGLSKEPGLLSAPMDSLLQDRKNLLELPDQTAIEQAFPEDLDFDTLSQLAPAF